MNIGENCNTLLLLIHINTIYTNIKRNGKKMENDYQVFTSIDLIIKNE